MGVLLNELNVKDYDYSYTERLICYSDLIVKELDIQETEITQSQADYYASNFAKICTKVLKIDLKYLPIILKVNGLSSSTEYNGFLRIKFIEPMTIDNFLKDNKKNK